MLTGVLLNALPKNEAEAFRELTWASASQHLGDQPEALAAISRICTVMTDSICDINVLLDEKLENDTKLKELVESLSEK